MTTAEQILDLVNRPPMHPDAATNRLILLTDIEECVLGSTLIREAEKNAQDLDYENRQLKREIEELEDLLDPDDEDD